MKDTNWYRQALEEDNPDWVEEIYRAEVALGVAENENIPVTREERDIKKGAVEAALQKAGLELEGHQGGFQEGDKQYHARMTPEGDGLVLESMDADIDLEDLKSMAGNSFVEFNDSRPDSIETRFDFLAAAERTTQREYDVIRKGGVKKARKELDRALNYKSHNPMGAKDTHKPSIDMDVLGRDIGITDEEYINMLEETGYHATLIDGENRPEIYGRMIEYLTKDGEQESFSGEDSEFFP